MKDRKNARSLIEGQGEKSEGRILSEWSRRANTSNRMVKNDRKNDEEANVPANKFGRQLVQRVGENQTFHGHEKELSVKKVFSQLTWT